MSTKTGRQANGTPLERPEPNTAFAREVPAALRKLSVSLFEDQEKREAFLAAIQGGNVERPAAIIGPQEAPVSGTAVGRAPFQPPWVLTLGAGLTSALLPETAYQLDLSSVFMAAPLQMLEGGVSAPRILDLCSAPGGKAVFAARLLQPVVLGCNEVIQKRIPMLISNLKRCRIPNAEVYSRDPEFFAACAPRAFDVVLADAPCSGQSLFAGGGAETGVFHETVVKKSALRQRRILAAAAQALRPGGHLLYMTCTFSLAENEKAADWFLRKHPSFEAVSVPFLAPFRSGHAEFPAYRLFPEQGLGRGGFTVLFRNTEQGSSEDLSAVKPIWRQDGSLGET